MDVFVPDMYQKSIFTINYQTLKKRGISCLLFDLDNTICPIHSNEISKKVKDLFAYLEISGFKVIIISNSPKDRVKPFKEKLNVDAAHSSVKPLKKKYKKIMKMYDFKDTDIAAIGDQLLTDVFGANRMGITSILINPISDVDASITKINRIIERKIYQNLEKKGFLKKGEYYE